MVKIKRIFNICFLLLLVSGVCKAQFLDQFDKKELEGWFFFTGDGKATMDFVQQEEGYATIFIDATNDQHNIWYAIIKRNISPYLNLKKLKGPDTELRVEARVRIHYPPRRVNMMVNTQRTSDFHHDLMEFEVPDTTWHVISMTTKGLDAVPGDSLYVQLTSLISAGINTRWMLTTSGQISSMLKKQDRIKEFKFLIIHPFRH